MLLSDLIAQARRVAVVGLAKNTGKTETLNTLLRELRERGTVGVTSVGRDGEQRDAIDARIKKPRVELEAGSMVATTDALLRASEIPYDLLEDTGIRTPLGRVLLARLMAAGAIEVAGPSAGKDVRVVLDAMLDAGAEHVLVDGAIDRRAASSPEVCDGVVLSTGAVLSERIEEVVAQTREAVELMCLPEPADARIRMVAVSRHESLLLGEPGHEPIVLDAHIALAGAAAEVAGMLRANPAASHLVLQGALCEPFLQGLLTAVRGRRLELVVADSTKVFLTDRGCEWYRRQGLSIRVITPVRLCALTLNPFAPRSHSFQSSQLRSLLEAAIPGIAVLDVRDRASRLLPTG